MALYQEDSHLLNRYFFALPPPVQNALLFLASQGYDIPTLCQSFEVVVEYRRRYLQCEHQATPNMSFETYTWFEPPAVTGNQQPLPPNTCFFCGKQTHHNGLKRHVEAHYIRFFCPHPECWTRGAIFGYGNSRIERLGNQHKSKHPECSDHHDWENTMRTTSAFVELGRNGRCTSDTIVDMHNEQLQLANIVCSGRDWTDFVAFCNRVTPDHILQVPVPSNSGLQAPVASAGAERHRDSGNLGAANSSRRGHQDWEIRNPMAGIADFPPHDETFAGVSAVLDGTEQIHSETRSDLGMTVDPDSGLGQSLSRRTGVHGGSINRTAPPTPDKPTSEAGETQSTAHVAAHDVYATGELFPWEIPPHQPQVGWTFDLHTPAQPIIAGPGHPPSHQELTEIPGPHPLAETVNAHVNRDPPRAGNVQVHPAQSDPLPDPLHDLIQNPGDQAMIIDGHRYLSSDEYSRLQYISSPPPFSSPTQYYKSRFPNNNNSATYSPDGYNTTDRAPPSTWPDPQPSTSHIRQPEPTFQGSKNMLGSSDNSPAPSPSSSWVRNNSDTSSTPNGGRRVPKRKRLSQHMAPLRQGSIEAWQTVVRFFA